MGYSMFKQRTCINCGKEETRPPHSKPTFLCSESCRKQRIAKKWRQQNPLPGPKSCEICGKEFYPDPHIYYKAKYCSGRCKKKGYYKNVVAFYKQHPRKKAEYHFEQRKRKKWAGNWWKALTRDNFTCKLCGKVGINIPHKERFVVVHHLDGEGETGGNNHALDNLMTLCYDCHEGMHGISLAYLDGRWQFVGKVLQYFGFVPPAIEKLS